MNSVGNPYIFPLSTFRYWRGACKKSLLFLFLCKMTLAALGGPARTISSADKEVPTSKRALVHLPMMKQETAFITTGDGCRIAYRLEGPLDKPVLVLSNSIATNLHMWDAQVSILTQHFRLLRFDNRGNGASEAPEGAYSIERMGRDVLELLDALEIPKVHFCGLSLGGLMAQWLGVYAPDRIEKLVLANTAPYLGPAPPWDALIQSLQSERDLFPLAETFLRNWLPPALLSRPNDPTVGQFRAMVLSTKIAGLKGCFAAVRDADMRPVLSLIQAPTLVLAGTQDAVTKPEYGREIAVRIRGAQFTLLPVVHLSNVEAPKAFLEAVLNFLLR